ncbi:MAG: hypothetical protein GX271_08120 [Clostridiales bacterium]|nr:hypothetical protein [Clostridiales bacterium]
MAMIILDAGHGGNDLGDVYGHRYEKTDNLRLTLALGDELIEYGYDVEYIRTTDIYVAINDRVKKANQLDGDFILSIHRIIGELNVFNSVLYFYVFELGGVAEKTAINIAHELRPLGFKHYSIHVRSENMLLRDTSMPALMMSICNLNSEHDNMIFDTRLHEIAEAIAKGIMKSIPLKSNKDNKRTNKKKGLSIKEAGKTNLTYTVQVGALLNYKKAISMYFDLLDRGYPAQFVYENPYYSVLIGRSMDLDLIAQLEYRLRLDGFTTTVVTL